MGLAWLLCALPLVAESTAPRIVVACEQTSALLEVSASTRAEPREYTVSVTNQSSRAILVPRSPIFGWRIESEEAHGWRLKAEGGPVRRINAKDEHLAVTGETQEGSELVEIAPSATYRWKSSLPQVDPLLLPASEQSATLKLTLFWAAPPGLVRSNRAVPPCALAPEWTVTVQKQAR
jgi:hypothetical protein